MAQHHMRRAWKEFYIESIDDQRSLESAWHSSYATSKHTFEVVKGTGFVRTNLPYRECRSLFRFAGVRWRDYVTGIDDTQPAGESNNSSYRLVPGQDTPAQEVKS